MPTANIDFELMASNIDYAVDALLRVRVMLGPGLGDVDVPEEALDAALQTDPAHLSARKAFDAVLTRLREVLPANDVALAFVAEEAANEAVSRSCDIAYRLGVGRRARGR